MSGKDICAFFKPYRPLTHLHLLGVVARARKLFPNWAKVSLRTRAGARTLIGGGGGGVVYSYVQVRPG